MARVSRKKQAGTQKQDIQTVRMWNAALYVRLSVEDNGKLRDSDSIENQTALLEEYVAARPYLRKAALFIDNGYTGTDFLRPEFTRMMEAVQSGIVDCVVVKDLSRLGRNYIETSQFLEKICPFYGLRFIAVNDNYDTATVTSEGQLSASLSNIVNDYYAKDISRKVTSALQSKMERGDYIGNYAPHGYWKDPENKNHLLICPETAPVIRQIFAWRAEGMSYMGINKRLNEAGIPSPSEYKREHGVLTNNNQKAHKILWNRHMVTEILHNAVYIGHLAQKKGSQCLYAGIPYHITGKDEWVIVRNTHEPLISEDLFEKVQSINREAAAKAKADCGKYGKLPKADNIYGKKLVCAECGAVMKLTRSISAKKDRAYFTFKCPTHAEHGAMGCKDVKIRKGELDEAVLAFLKAQMTAFLDVERDIQRLLAVKESKRRQSRARQEIKTLRQKLANKQSLLSGLYVDLKDGFLSQEEYADHRKLIWQDIEALTLHLSELEAAEDEAESQLTGEKKWRSLIRQYENATELTAEMVDAFLASVSVHEDRSLDIRLSYMDELAALMQARERLQKEVA